MSRHDQQRAAALAILNSDTKLSRKAGSFLGECAVDDTPLSEKQAAWFASLAEKANVKWEAPNGR